LGNLAEGEPESGLKANTVPGKESSVKGLANRGGSLRAKTRVEIFIFGWRNFGTSNPPNGAAIGRMFLPSGCEYKWHIDQRVE
jgi:hypothetical protein